MPTSKYWTERAERRAERLYEEADKTLKELQDIFKRTNREISKEISFFYEKYGKNKKSPIFDTLEDGTQILVGESVKRVVPMNEAMKYNRLDSLQKQLNKHLNTLAKDEKVYMTTNLALIAQESYTNLYFDIFQGYGVGYSFDLLDDKLVKQLISNPVHGQDYSKRIWNNTRLLANQVNQELINGLTQGTSTREMSKRLTNKVGSGYKVAERLMRTEITNSYNQATLQGYNDSGIVKQYEYLATLDNRTSAICQALDGKVFNVKDAIVGLNYPPMHVRCRSTTVSKFDDEVFERRARAENGTTYTVPSNMAYKDWKAIYVDKTMTLEEWKK